MGAVFPPEEPVIKTASYDRTHFLDSRGHSERMESPATVVGTLHLSY